MNCECEDTLASTDRILGLPDNAKISTSANYKPMSPETFNDSHRHVIQKLGLFSVRVQTG
ncbi:hypothetical protein SAMN04487917_103146 [Arthrobacter sp. yr096]|nr:hypothetical protein SAMN04487917_103146 [Arthrobacter sp. yr096]